MNSNKCFEEIQRAFQKPCLIDKLLLRLMPYLGCASPCNTDDLVSTDSLVLNRL